MFFRNGTVMTNISLTAEQKSALESRHRRVRDARECDRIKAVLLRSEGWPIKSIAQALRLSEHSISRHLDDRNSVCSKPLTLSEGSRAALARRGRLLTLEWKPLPSGGGGRPP